MGYEIYYIDFILFEVIAIFKTINSEYLDLYPRLIGYDQRLRSPPVMKKFLKSSERITYPVVVPPKKFDWTKD
ncbi:glutathione S-transferase class-mu 26 kDa isozyme 1-like [Tropilaelaps mercedesae]|uniref:Glutathione S-transferase class-mu 26 kDa isozyme 1-like n=1 Tax=Tropilaelaps mercedesae TaxID=418985 RepID=A0A1V9XSN6_9ACAR|nr:glutathione S-transferase class-mu 26 kDa isozyme 1-like [Tropilaelaps mercedesae]